MDRLAKITYSKIYLPFLHCLQYFRGQFTEETTVISSKLVHVPAAPMVCEFVD